MKEWIVGSEIYPKESYQFTVPQAGTNDPNFPGFPKPQEKLQAADQIKSPIVQHGGPMLSDFLLPDTSGGGTSAANQPIFIQQAGTNWGLILLVLVAGIGAYIWWKSRKHEQ